MQLRGGMGAVEPLPLPLQPLRARLDPAPRRRQQPLLQAVEQEPPVAQQPPRIEQPRPPRLQLPAPLLQLAA